MTRTATTVNPATGEALEAYNAADLDAVLDVLAAVHAAQPGWAAVPVEERADRLRAVGAQLRKQRDELAALMTAEMGKPVAEARAEVEKSATACATTTPRAASAVKGATCGPRAPVVTA
jgi:succinate-semialdehyde dehydrogenase / glutarate-semialdehyde dehydrogenase